MSTTPIPQPRTNVFDQTDTDGSKWRFPQQQYNFSCGPACVKYVKSLLHNLQFSELEARQQISRFEFRKPTKEQEKKDALEAAKKKASDEKSVKAVKQALKTILTPEPDKAHENRKGILMPTWIGDSSWGALSTKPEFILQALIGAPLPVPTARLVKGDYLRHLQLTSQSFPAIIGVMFVLQHSAAGASGMSIEDKKKTARQYKEFGIGGHFVVCVGPNHSGSQFIVLDPMNGLKYIDRADVTADCILYDDGAAIGKVDEDIRKLSRNPQKVDVGLVDHVSQKGLSKCCLIVTHPWEPGD